MCFQLHINGGTEYADVSVAVAAAIATVVAAAADGVRTFFAKEN